LKAHFVLLKAEFQTCRLVKDGLQMDIAGLRAPDLVGDLKARDFTVNALAWDLGDYLRGWPNIMDPTGGLEDLENRVLRLAGPNVLADDPLRVLRAFRFISTLGLRIAPGVSSALEKAGPDLATVARERIAHEWLLCMAGKQVDQAVRAMQASGVLTLLVPDLEQGRGVDQNPYHHLDVLEHNLACLESLAAIQKDPEKIMAGHGRAIAEYLAGDDRKRALLFTAALFHDIGKPTTRKETGPGWATFYYHDKAGAKLAAPACRALGLGKADTAYVTHMISEHMRPFQLMGAALNGSLTAKGIRRLLSALGDDLPGLFALAMADTMAGKGPERPPEAEQRLLDLYDHTIELRDRCLAKALAAPPLVNGNDVMDHLGMPPGRKLGHILNTLREAQLDGQIQTKDQALALAKDLYTESVNVD
jgi:poly(A) polymerase